MFLTLVIFSAIAIAGVALLLNALGFSRTQTFDTLESARNAFLEENPDAQILKAALSSDNGAAVFQLADDNSRGVLKAVGKFNLAKTITGADISQCRHDGETLLLRFHDYADPEFKITFPTREEAQQWYALFTMKKGQADA